MARFNIYTGNHIPTARISVEDHVTWIKAGLEALGHEVTVSETDISRSAMNIIFECFVPPFSEVIANGASEFIIVMTEYADGGGFNRRRDESWSIRWREFWKVAHSARAIWTLFEGNEKAMDYPAPASYLELGFAEALVPKVDLEPDVSFGFFGSRNEHRNEIIDRLIAKGYQVLMPRGIQPSDVLTTQMGRIKVLLDPRGPNLIPMPSITRCGRGIHARRGVLAEKVPHTQGLTKLVTMTAKEGAAEFVDHALEMVNGPWRQKADEAFEIARTTMPMAACVERALDESLRVGFRKKGGAARHRMTEWRLMADVRDPAELDLFLERTLPSLLTRGNVPSMASATTVTAEVVVRRDQMERVTEHPAFIDFRKMCFTSLNWTIESDEVGESVSPFGLTPDLGRRMRQMVLRWAGAPVYMVRIDRGRVFSDGALMAMLNRSLEVEKRTGAFPSNIVVPMVAVDPAALAGWPAYRPWSRVGNVDIEPERPNEAHALVRTVLASMPPVPSDDYLDTDCHAVRFGTAWYRVGPDALLLAPISPVSTACFGRSVPPNQSAAAWRSEPDSTEIILDSDQALVVVADAGVAEPAPMSSSTILMRIERISATARPSSVVTRRRAAWIASANWRQNMLVHAGEIDALKLARAEADADEMRAWLRPAASSAIIPAASPAIPPLGPRDQQPYKRRVALAG